VERRCYSQNWQRSFGSVVLGHLHLGEEQGIRRLSEDNSEDQSWNEGAHIWFTTSAKEINVWVTQARFLAAVDYDLTEGTLYRAGK